MANKRTKVGISIDADLCLEYCIQLRQIKVDLEALRDENRISVDDGVIEFCELIEQEFVSAIVEQLSEEDYKKLIESKK